MNILQIIPYFYPAWAYGGTPRVVFDLCRELVKQGHDVSVYTTDSLDKNARINRAVSNQQSAISGPHSAFRTPHSAIGKPETRNPKPETRNPKPETRNPKPETRFYFDAEVEGIKVRYFKNVSNRLAFTQKLFLTPGFFPSLRDVLKNTDIVHLQEYRTLQNVSARKLCKQRGIPYVLSAHGAILRIMGREGRKGLFDRLWGWNILKDARKLIALTDQERRQYEQFGIDGEKIEVVPNGIDLSQFASLPEKGSFRAKYGLDTCPIILFLGRIHRIKGIDILIDAFAELRREGIECKLIIAGPDDGFKRECGMRIVECGMKLVDLSEKVEGKKGEVREADVMFTGMVSGDEKLSLFVDADVTVLPSRFENFPSVPFESMMCGTPVVVSTACGVAEMIEAGGAGYLSEVEDPADLKEKIWQVFKNHEEARISVERGRVLVKENLTWSIVVQMMLQVYSRCLN
jgi:glycosyltransferase involved in cell wall biosynthesis